MVVNSIELAHAYHMQCQTDLKVISTKRTKSRDRSENLHILCICFAYIVLVRYRSMCSHADGATRAISTSQKKVATIFAYAWLMDLENTYQTNSYVSYIYHH